MPVREESRGSVLASGVVPSIGCLMKYYSRGRAGFRLGRSPDVRRAAPGRIRLRLASGDVTGKGERVRAPRVAQKRAGKLVVGDLDASKRGF